MGRPTKLTPEIQDKIIDAIQAGNYQDAAARYAGIDPATYYRWMSKGEDPDSPYSEFREAIERAKAAAEVESVAIIKLAARDGTWQAAAWWLERTRPQKFGRKERYEVTGAEGGNLQVNVSMQDLEEKVSRILDARKGE
jgi:transposase